MDNNNYLLVILLILNILEHVSSKNIAVFYTDDYYRGDRIRLSEDNLYFPVLNSTFLNQISSIEMNDFTYVITACTNTSLTGRCHFWRTLRSVKSLKNYPGMHDAIQSIRADYIGDVPGIYLYGKDRY